jgi:hypothetical protein
MAAPCFFHGAVFFCGKASERASPLPLCQTQPSFLGCARNDGRDGVTAMFNFSTIIFQPQFLNSERQNDKATEKNIDFSLFAAACGGNDDDDSAGCQAEVGGTCGGDG